jgi:hypothetical protein
LYINLFKKFKRKGRKMLPVEILVVKIAIQFVMIFVYALCIAQVITMDDIKERKIDRHVIIIMIIITLLFTAISLGLWIW